MIPPEAKAKIEADLDHFRQVSKDWRPCCVFHDDGDRLYLDDDAIDHCYEEREDEYQAPRPGTAEAYLRR